MTETPSPPAPTRPKNAIVILLDSLNRHMLGSYGGTEFETPNLDRFAARSLRFQKHYSGSLPCMPARHDILCGALDFLWRPWGTVLGAGLITQPPRASLHAGLIACVVVESDVEALWVGAFVVGRAIATFGSAFSRRFNTTDDNNRTHPC